MHLERPLTFLKFTDAYYIATLISALACVTVSTATPEHGELTRTEAKLDQNEEDVELLKSALTEVDRYRSMDRLIPSVHNVVTVAALEVRTNHMSRTRVLQFFAVPFYVSNGESYP